VLSQAIFGMHIKLSTTGLAAMMLFTRVNMLMFLELLRTARRTRVFHGHNCLLAFPVLASGSGQAY
jgi:hypothetical protein